MRQRLVGNCSAMNMVIHMLVWVGVHVKDRVVSFGVAERCSVHMHS